MQQHTTIDRRNFLRTTGITGAAFVLGLRVTQSNLMAEVVNLSKQPADYSITPYVIIEKSGRITLMNPKPEMGQGTYQSIPALIAEELEVSLDHVMIRQTAGEKEYGRQAAGGSSSVRGNYFSLRKVGASARMMLAEAASRKWEVPVSECTAENAHIHHLKSNRSLSYGELADAASRLKVPDDPVLKDAKDFKILGKSMPRNDIPLKTKGEAIYGMDAEVPGMLYASVEHCPVFGSTLKSYDDSGTLKIPGVKKVIKTKRMLGKNQFDGVAVVADNYWSALQGRKALKTEWDYHGNEHFNSEDYAKHLRDLSKSDGIVAHDSGKFDTVYAAAEKKTEAFYETPVVSHSPMEPMNCLAYWRPDGQVEIWASSQGASLIKGELSEVLNIPQDKIIPHILFSGGAFGRRLKSDFATEAALISHDVGKPVKVIWTREDDTQLGPFRPMTFSALKGAVSSEGKLIAFQHKVISPSMAATENASFDKTRLDGSMVEGISDQEYIIPNMKNAWVFAELHIPMAAWRAVTSTTLAFAHECFIDELAVLAGKDPMDFRIDMTPQDSDTRRMLTKLRVFSGWDKPLPAGWGRGVAQYKFFAGLAAHVVEVSKKPDNGVRIEKIHAVIDLGTVVNPDNVKAQVEGAIVMAITAATKNGIRFENGKSVQTNFDNNPVLRINEMPRVEILVLADGGPVIKGVGEPGLPALAPALCNAIYAATGTRIRRLPFDLDHPEKA